MFDIVAQLASLLGGPNGEQAAMELDKAGIPPPSKAMLLGGPKPGGDGFAPAAGFVPADQNDPGVAAPAAPAAAPAAPGAGGPDLTKLALAANQGLKAPEPIKPIMQGGVTGGVKAPEMGVKGNAAAIQALMSTMGGGAVGKDPLRVPSLGALMKGKM